MSEPTTLHPVNDDAMRALFLDARTARSFADAPISDAELHRIHELTMLGPTSMNLQSLRIVFVRAGEAKDRLLTHVADGNKEKAASAPVNAILAADIDFHDSLHITNPHSPNARDSFADVERRTNMARNQAWLAAGYFMMAVRALGYAVGPMGGFKASALDADFFSESSWRSICVVNIGKPGENPWRERAPRLSFEQSALIL
ncbi:MAG: malonic semialdehyde reductase [Actinobacteria bacterium]|nr:malonic semialdehyde reductase [Actinomycetota bacterium]